ncbi:hypothetical protein GCM10010994_46100 [Chelatococcus reniformis]|uniref:DNA ligase (ATP) n=1 Tax=Chelatococcus reniformis TaxID=1494448 RepID=A0A916XMM9_9HYPH|nr:hypothetical protein GCM10010994_46100 [Chelatococcus reniformis]
MTIWARRGHDRTARFVGGLRLAGVSADGKLVSVGGVGTGFTREVAARLKRRLDEIRQPKPTIPRLRSRTVV